MILGARSNLEVVKYGGPKINPHLCRCGNEETDPVLRQPIAEDEVYGALDVAVLEVVATFVVI